MAAWARAEHPLSLRAPPSLPSLPSRPGSGSFLSASAPQPGSPAAAAARPARPGLASPQRSAAAPQVSPAPPAAVEATVGGDRWGDRCEAPARPRLSVLHFVSAALGGGGREAGREGREVPPGAAAAISHPVAPRRLFPPPPPRLPQGLLGPAGRCPGEAGWGGRKPALPGPAARRRSRPQAGLAPSFLIIIFNYYFPRGVALSEAHLACGNWVASRASSPPSHEGKVRGKRPPRPSGGLSAP